MKVKKLMAILNQYDPNMDIVLPSSFDHGSYYDLTAVTSVCLSKERDVEFGDNIYWEDPEGYEPEYIQLG